jgi:hypothetical protein
VEYGTIFQRYFLSAVVIFDTLASKAGIGNALILWTGILLFSVLIISECWYMRYVPQLWFIPVIMLMASEAERGKIIRG